MANILGVSIGTRNVGMAVIRLRKLIDYRIRTFPGKWTETKCKSILELIKAIVQQNEITDLTLKIPKPSHCSENIEALIQGIEELGKAYSFEVHRCTIQDITFGFRKSERSKHVMVAALIEKYPQLKERWRNHGKRAQAYNAKLFEAIACAELALRAGH